MPLPLQQPVCRVESPQFRSAFHQAFLRLAEAENQGFFAQPSEKSN
jgi:hypothetical protein